MSPTPNRSSALQCFERGNTIKMQQRDFYLGLPHLKYPYVPTSENLPNLSNFPMFPFPLHYTEGIEAQMHGYYGNTHVVTMVTRMLLLW